jgi:hypothetical protein
MHRAYEEERNKPLGEGGEPGSRQLQAKIRNVNPVAVVMGPSATTVVVRHRLFTMGTTSACEPFQFHRRLMIMQKKYFPHFRFFLVFLSTVVFAPLVFCGGDKNSKFPQVDDIG